MVEASGAASGEIRQRWRIAFARGEPIVAVNQAGVAERWEEAVRRAGLPLALSAGRNPRPRMTFAAPLPVGMPAEHELLDLILTGRVPTAEVRARLAAVLPPGLRIVEAFDVWTGEPALPAALAAADYRVHVEGPAGTDPAAAGRRLLAASELPRERVKGEGRAISYDLRPLLLSLAVSAAPSEPGSATAHVLRMRLRHAQEGGIGRPDEVLLALGDELGPPLEVGLVVRERLWTADELRPV